METRTIVMGEGGKTNCIIKEWNIMKPSNLYRQYTLIKIQGKF